MTWSSIPLRALTGYLLVRGGVHQVAYAHALKNLTGRRHAQAVPVAADRPGQNSRVPAVPQAREALAALSLLARRPPERSTIFNGAHPKTGEALSIAEKTNPERAPAYDLPPQTAVFAPGPEPEEIAEIAAKVRDKAGLPKQPTGTVANDG